MTLSEKQLKTLLALAVFAVAFITYMLTMAPTVSFWDCGELVGASNILGNPHPPGNPLFTTMARVFIMVAPFKEAATRVNFISVLTSALTVMMCFLFTVKALNILFEKKIGKFALYCSAIIGSLLVTYSDTFWFSAVEAEVYGSSMFLVLCISWLSLEWYENRGTARANRMLVMITYLAFLGMGIHPFSFITIPAVGLFIVFSDDNHRKNWMGFGIVFVVFGVLAAMVSGGMNQDIVWAFIATAIIGAIVASAVPDMSFDLPLAIAGLGLFSIVYGIGSFIFFALALLVISFFAWRFSGAKIVKDRWKLAMWLSIVAILGFSSYAYVPLRSSVSPKIDEGEPRTWPAFKDYLERKQYGSESMITRAFHRRGQLQNQILVHPHMGYGGYMLGQYFPWKVGETRADENEPTVRKGIINHEFNTLTENLGTSPRLQFILFLLFQLPFAYGLYLAYKRNKHIAIYLGLLYAVGSYALVFYMNFADGSQMEMRDYEYWKQSNFDPKQKPENVHIEVRDRDYFFTPGFIFMGILFGVSSAFLLNKLGQGGRRKFLPRGVGVALASLAFVVPAYSNWHEHDRTGDYIPWDYAYNLLMSCRQNAILFTNGDNDTFPLWFIQQVEGIRTDVRVVNLSLVNTNWYIRQLKSHEPKLVVGFTDEEIDKLEPQAWPSKAPIKIAIPNSKIEVELEPRQYLKVQDIMVLNLAQNNYPAHPIQFAVTVSDDNMMGLEKYLVMEGMVYTLVEEKKNKEIDAEATAKMVDSVYRFRGLGDPNLFVDLNTEGLLTNYSATNFRLVMWAQEQVTAIDAKLGELQKLTGPADTDSVKSLISNKQKDRQDKIDFAEKYLQLNSRILPREWRNNYYGAQFYSTIKDYGKAEGYYKKGMMEAPNPKLFGGNLAQLYMEQNRFAQAESLLISLKNASPNDFELWYGLSELYQKRGEIPKARAVLAEWLKGNPSHQYAGMVDQQIRTMDMQMRNPAPAGNGPSANPGVNDGGTGAPAGAPSAGTPGAGGIPGLSPGAQAPAKASPAAEKPSSAAPAKAPTKS